jgi:hypothetical protein
MRRVTVIDWVSGPEAAEVFAVWTAGQVAISLQGTDPDRAILRISDKDDAERD